jgi:hypothetical protein
MVTSRPGADTRPTLLRRRSSPAPVAGAGTGEDAGTGTTNAADTDAGGREEAPAEREVRGLPAAAHGALLAFSMTEAAAARAADVRASTSTGFGATDWLRDDCTRAHACTQEKESGARAKQGLEIPAD